MTATPATDVMNVDASAAGATSLAGRPVPASTLLATASRDATARLWNTGTGTPAATLTGHAGPLCAVAFSPDGTLVATASFDQTAGLWQWDQSAGGDPDGTVTALAAASDDEMAGLWE